MIGKQLHAERITGHLVGKDELVEASLRGAGTTSLSK